MKRKINVQNDNLMLMNEYENERCNRLDKEEYASTARFLAYVDFSTLIWIYIYYKYYETVLVENLYQKGGIVLLEKTVGT